VVGFAYYKVDQTRRTYAKIVDEMQKSHDDEVSKINTSILRERAEKEAQLKQLQDTLAASEKKYEEAKKKLTEDSAAQSAAIVRKYGNNPVKLAKEFSRATGVKVAFDEANK
jgi:hypothetical protein